MSALVPNIALAAAAAALSAHHLRLSGWRWAPPPGWWLLPLISCGLVLWAIGIRLALQLIGGAA